MTETGHSILNCCRFWVLTPTVAKFDEIWNLVQWLIFILKTVPPSFSLWISGVPRILGPFILWMPFYSFFLQPIFLFFFFYNNSRSRYPVVLRIGTLSILASREYIFEYDKLIRETALRQVMTWIFFFKFPFKNKQLKKDPCW